MTLFPSFRSPKRKTTQSRGRQEENQAENKHTWHYGPSAFDAIYARVYHLNERRQKHEMAERMSSSQGKHRQERGREDQVARCEIPSVDTNGAINLIMRGYQHRRMNKRYDAASRHKKGSQNNCCINPPGSGGKRASRSRCFFECIDFSGHLALRLRHDSGVDVTPCAYAERRF